MQYISEMGIAIFLSSEHSTACWTSWFGGWNLNNVKFIRVSNDIFVSDLKQWFKTFHLNRDFPRISLNELTEQKNRAISFKALVLRILLVHDVRILISIVNIILNHVRQ